MINWRTVLGLVFLLGGMAKMFAIFAGNPPGGTPVYTEIGCIVWMLVGLFLIIKGITNKPQ